MKFSDILPKIEEIINRYGKITFSYPSANNGSSFGLISISNKEGLYLSGDYHYLGDGDVATSDVEIHDNIEDAFKHIWNDINCYDDKYGDYNECEFIFEEVKGLWIHSCYYIIK